MDKFCSFFSGKNIANLGKNIRCSVSHIRISMNVVRFAYSEDGFRIKCYSVIVKLGYS